MQDFRELDVWRRAHAYRLAIYEATARFPAHEGRGLIAQLRRSASSICWNIAEGCGRRTDADFARFLQIAAGSAFESLDQLIQARDLRYLPADEFTRLSEQQDAIARKLNRFLARLRSAPARRRSRDR